MELSIYDCYRSDTVKTSTQVRQLSSVWHRLRFVLKFPKHPLSYSLLLIRNIYPVMCKTIFFKPGTACDLTLLCCSRERQAINPKCARLQFQLSRCWAALWITLKSWREPCVAKTLKQKDRQSAQRETMWDKRKHISFWWRNTSALGGRILWSAALTHEWNFPTESSASLFSPSLLFWFHFNAFPP